MLYLGRSQQGFKISAGDAQKSESTRDSRVSWRERKISGVLVFLFASLQSFKGAIVVIYQVRNELAAVASLKSWLSRQGKVCYMQAKLD